MTPQYRNLTAGNIALGLLLALCLLAGHAFAQGTTAFTYQGRLNDAGQPANGAYDLQFALYDANSAGNQIGANVVAEDVAVTNGVFTVQLDFGATAFNGAARHLEIGVRPGAGTGSFTTLTPRSPFTPTPYAIRSQNAASADNATQLNGVAASQYVQTNDTRLSDARTPTAGSENYIQNGTTPQAASNFNISGDGTAGGTLSSNFVNAATQYNIGGNRVLSNGGASNLFAGVNAGLVNSFGTDNTFIGDSAGKTNFSGSQNAVFGTEAGRRLLSGSFNTLIGRRAGETLTIGAGNVFVGNDTGFASVSSSSSTLLGSGANFSTDGLAFATAIGAGAVVANSNSVVLGRAADTVRVPGNLNVTGTFTGSFTVPAANLTGTVSVANGGTGVSATGAAGNFLRSDGAAWTSAPIQLADLPNLGNSFIQNGTTPQTGDFNISGSGTLGGVLTANNVNAAAINASLVNANQFYSIGSSRVLSNDGFNNLFAGVNAGGNASASSNNAFFGANAGAANTGGSNNSFFGANAGAANTVGGNSFFGYNAGAANTSGGNNSFFGVSAGASNTTATSDSFFGTAAGASNMTGEQNSFFGTQAGTSNVAGNENSYFGDSSGILSTGSFNAFFGAGAGYNTKGSFNTFIGRRAGQSVTTGSGNVFIGNDTGLNVSTGNSNTALGSGTNVGAGISFATAIGSLATVATSNTIVLGRSDGTDAVNVPGQLNVSGVISFVGLGNGGNVQLCRNTSGQISGCSSSLRYKTNIAPYRHGLDFINRLQPISFTWKDGGMRDLGFSAEDVAKVDPLLAVYDKDGRVEGVKYDRLSALLVNAVQEQQTQITTLRDENQRLTQQSGASQAQLEQLKTQNATLQTQLAALQQAVCAVNPKAAVCQ